MSGSRGYGVMMDAMEGEEVVLEGAFLVTWEATTPPVATMIRRLRLRPSNQ
jgi:hypothetical protein